MFDVIREEEDDNWGNYHGGTSIQGTYPTYAQAKAAATRNLTDEWSDDTFTSYWIHDEKLGDKGDVGHDMEGEEPEPFFIKATFPEGEIMRVWVEERDVNGKSVVPDDSWFKKPWTSRRAARDARDALKVKKEPSPKATAKPTKQEAPKERYIIMWAEGDIEPDFELATTIGRLGMGTVFDSVLDANELARSYFFKQALGVHYDIDDPEGKHERRQLVRLEENVDAAAGTYRGVGVDSATFEDKTVWVMQMHPYERKGQDSKAGAGKGIKTGGTTAGKKETTTKASAKRTANSTTTPTAKRGKTLQTARRGGASSSGSRATHAQGPSTEVETRPRQTARRGGGPVQTAKRGGGGPKQTARRGGAPSQTGRIELSFTF